MLSDLIHGSALPVDAPALVAHVFLANDERG
jgi:hypothetical protein